jgi:hypothetical protein
VFYPVIEPLTNMVLLRTSLPGLGSGSAFPQAETQSQIDQLYNQESEEDHQSRLDREYIRDCIREYMGGKRVTGYVDEYKVCFLEGQVRAS